MCADKPTALRIEESLMTEEREIRVEPSRSSPSLPVLLLSGLGALIAVLGLFAAGNMVIVGIGLAAIAVAGVIGIAERVVDRR